MVERNQISTLTVRGKAENLDQVAAKLRGIAGGAQQAGQATDAFTRAGEESGRRLGNLDRQLANLDKQLAGAPRAFAEFERGAKLAQRALDAGQSGIAEYSRRIQELQQRLQSRLAPNLALDVNQSGLTSLINGQTELSASARRAAQDLLQQGEAARRAAEEQARAQERVTGQVARLRAQIDPYGAAQAKLNAEIAEYNALAATGAISSGELAQATAVANQRFQETAVRLGVANDNIRLTNGQMGQFGYQINDIATMVALGASPFQIIASQGGQIVQVFGDHPQGVRGTIKALGGQIAGLVSRISPVGIGFTVAAAAVGAFAYAFRSDMPDMEETLKTHEDLIGRIADQYDGLAEKIATIGNAAEGVGLNVEAGSLGRDLAALIENEMRELDAALGRRMGGFTGRIAEGIFGLDNVLAPTARQFQPIIDVVDEFREELKDGDADALAFQQRLAAMYETAGDDAAMKRAIEAAFNYAEELKGLQVQADQTRAAIEEMQAALPSLDEQADRFDAFGGGVDFLERFDPEAFEEWRSGLEKQAEEMKQAAEDARAFDDAMADQRRTIDETVEGLQTQIDMFGRSEGAIAAAEFRMQALAEAERLAAEAGENVAVPPDQIAAIDSAAEKIAVMTDRLKELNEQAQRDQQIADFISDLQMDIDTVGMSDVEAEILRTLDRLELSYDSIDGTRIAGMMRYREKVEEANEAMMQSRDIARDFVSTLLDGLYNGEDALEGLVDSFAALGRQFAQMGLEKLFDRLEGGAGTFASGPGFSLSAPTVAEAPTIEMQRGPLVELSGRAGEEISSSIMDSYAAAIRKIESGSYGGNYGALGPITRTGDRAYGAYQVMGANIASWTKEATGKMMTAAEFLGDRAAQDKVFFTKFGQSVEKFGNVSDAVSIWFSGKPLNSAGNASDILGTSVPEYVRKFDSALAGVGGETTLLPRIMTSAVGQGVEEGLTSHIRHTSGMGVGYDASGQGGFFQRGGMNVLGAGAGAFFGGMQSGNPLMGGVSGALSGFGAASSISGALNIGMGLATGLGVVGGAVLGIIGGIIGNAKKKREERRRAQQELQSQMGAISSFLDEISGIFAGEYLQRFRETSDELQKIRDLAMKARDMDLVREIDDATETFFANLIEDWNSSVGSVMESMNAGYGFNGAFAEAKKSIEEFGKGLVGFVEDAKFFAESAGDYNKALDIGRGGRLNALDPQISFEYNKNAGIPGEYVDFVNRNAVLFQKLQFAPYTAFSNIASGDGPRGGRAMYESLDGLRHALRDMGVEFDELGEPIKETVDAVAQAASVLEAQRAAQQAALLQLSGAEEFTAIQETIQSLTGMAQGLDDVLEDLGLTADEATAKIQAHLQIAMEGLVREYENTLQRSINEARGADFINEVADAQELYNERLIDARELGLSTDAALEELNLRLTDIAAGADLSEAQLKALAEVFPEIASSLLGIDTADYANALADAQSKVEDAEANLRRAYEEKLSEIEGNIDALERFRDALADLRADMRIDPSMSPFGAKDRLAEAQKQFRETAAAALSGDEDAQSRLAETARQYWDAAQTYLTSSAGAFDIWQEIDSTLANADRTAGRQLTEAERQRSLLEEQVGKLIDINDAVLTVADAIAALASAQSGMSDAEKELIDFITGQKDRINNSVPSNVDRLYRDVLGRPAEQAGIDFWRSIVGSGALTDEMYKLFVDVARRNGEAIMPDYQGYAAGGMHMGGLRLVGERGPELEVTGPARIWSHDQTRQMFSGGGNDALLEEVRALRRDNAEMRAELKRLTAVSFEGHQQTTSAVREGNDISADMASDMQREKSKSRAA